ncbi:recombinase family protein [Acidobacteriota bacterium]
MKKQKSIRAVKAITISRVSTEEQAKEERSSLPSQVRDNRKYCEDKGLEIIAEFSFDESASKDKRRKFEKAIKLIENSEECIALVVDRVDRFQRSFKESVEFEEFRKTGKIELHFVRQGLTLHRNSTAYELMGWDAHTMFARAYVLQLSENIRKGIKEKLAKGEYPGYVPTGLRNVTVDVGDNTFVNKIEVDSERSHFIKRIFQLYATGKYSLSQVAEIVNNSGFTTKKKRVRNSSEKLEKTNARRANKTDIFNILKNPFYYGEFLWRDPETGERRLYDSKGSYPTLIDKSLFKQAQNVLNSNNRRKGGYKKKTFKFRGLLKCQFCGSTLTPEEMSRSYKNKSAKNASTVYYHCTSSKALVDPSFYEKKYGTDHSGVHVARSGKRKGEKIIGCPQRWWKEDEIEKIILGEFDMMHYDPSVFERLKKLLRADYEERINMADSQIKGLEAEYKKNEKLIKSFTLKFASITDKRLEQDMMKTYDLLKAKRDELKEEMRIFEEAKEIDTDETVDTLTLCCNLREHYLKLNLEEKQELILLCFSRISLMRGEYRLKKGKGRKMHMDSWSPILNEPFQTLRSLKIDELVAHEEKRNINLTKRKNLIRTLN